jgi:hypothetical protein
MDNEHQSDYATIGDLITKMHNATKDEEGNGCASMFAAAVFAGLLINSNENDPKEKTEYITEAIRVMTTGAVIFMMSSLLDCWPMNLISSNRNVYSIQHYYRVFEKSRS